MHTQIYKALPCLTADVTAKLYKNVLPLDFQYLSTYCYLPYSFICQLCIIIRESLFLFLFFPPVLWEEL